MRLQVETKEGLSKNLDQKMHRSLPAEAIKRIGRVAIEESALLGTQDCKLVECVMNWAAKPCQIVSREEVQRLLDDEGRSSVSPKQDGLPYDGTEA